MNKTWFYGKSYLLKIENRVCRLLPDGEKRDLFRWTSLVLDLPFEELQLPTLFSNAGALCRCRRLR